MVRMKILENANKVTFLIENYPEKNLSEIIGMLQIPAIDINNAIWFATEQEWISEPDTDEGTVRHLKRPDDGYHFGQTVTGLQESIIYAFRKLAKKQTDLEENYLGHYLGGYKGHDSLIAMRDLMNKNAIAEYTIADDVQDDGSEYTFYTLAENRDKEWGRLQFKKAPESESKDGPATEDDK